MSKETVGFGRELCRFIRVRLGSQFRPDQQTLLENPTEAMEEVFDSMPTKPTIDDIRQRFLHYVLNLEADGMATFERIDLPSDHELNYHCELFVATFTYPSILYNMVNDILFVGGEEFDVFDSDTEFETSSLDFSDINIAINITHNQGLDVLARFCSNLVMFRGANGAGSRAPTLIVHCDNQSAKSFILKNQHNHIVSYEFAFQDIDSLLSFFPSKFPLKFYNLGTRVIGFTMRENQSNLLETIQKLHNICDFPIVVKLQHSINTNLSNYTRRHFMGTINAIMTLVQKLHNTTKHDLYIWCASLQEETASYQPVINKNFDEKKNILVNVFSNDSITEMKALIHAMTMSKQLPTSAEKQRQ